jgi:hypothetical protein
MSSRGSSSLYSESCVGVGTVDVANLGAEFQASCRMASRSSWLYSDSSRDSSSVYSDCCVVVGTTGVRLGCARLRWVGLG